MSLFRGHLSTFSLADYLHLLVNARRTLVLAVRSPFVEGEVHLAEGNLYHAETLSPRPLVGYRALDLMLGLREGLVEAIEKPMGRRPTLAGDLLTLAFAIDRASLWKKSEALPKDWSLRVYLARNKRGVQLARTCPEAVRILHPALNKPLTEVLLLYRALPSSVGWSLSVMAKAGLVLFAEEPPQEGGLFGFWRTGRPRNLGRR